MPASRRPAISSGSPASTSAIAGAVVEADERVADDEAALGEAAPVLRQRHGRLQPRDVVVGEVADDRQPELGRLVEADDPRAGAHPRVAAEPAALDRLEDEARRAGVAQAQVGARAG